MSVELQAWTFYNTELMNSDMIIDAAPNCLATECLTGLKINANGESHRINMITPSGMYYLGYYTPALQDKKNNAYLYNGKLLWSINGNKCIYPSDEARKFWPGALLSTIQMQIAEEAGWDMSKLHLVHYGIDTELYRPTSNPTRDYFLYVSRPHRDKGLFEFLDLAREFPNEVFIYACDAATKDHQYYLSQALSMSKEIPNVRYAPLNGSIATKVELYQNAKALVIPLRPDYVEIMGLVFMESLACGTPIITAKHGGQRDILTPEIGTMCYSKEDYVDALRNVDKLNTTKCRQQMESNFTGEHWAKRYLQAFKDAYP